MEWFSYLQSLGMVLLILSLLPLGAHLYRKYKVKNLSGGEIKIIEVKPITYKAQILLIEVQGKRYLIGLSDKGFTNLGEVKSDAS